MTLGLLKSKGCEFCWLVTDAIGFQSHEFHKRRKHIFLQETVWCLLLLTIAMRWSNTVDLLFKRFFLIGIEWKCFLNSFFENVNLAINTWHSLFSFEVLVNLYSSPRYRKVVLLIYTHSHRLWTWTWCRKNSENDSWSQLHLTCQTSVSFQFFQWVLYGNNNQIKNSNCDMVCNAFRRSN